MIPLSDARIAFYFIFTSLMPEQNTVVYSPCFLSLQSSNIGVSVAMAESITDEKNAHAHGSC